MSAGAPEEAIAFDEGWVRSRLADGALTLSGVWPGTWTGRGEGRTFQDIVLATKP
jgi:hypothetical protein